jgi:hypothetical protein
MMVEAGGVGVFRALKARKLLILQDAQNSKNAEIALNWNVSGTRPWKRGAVPPRTGDNLSVKDAAANRALFCVAYTLPHSSAPDPIT